MAFRLRPSLVAASFLALFAVIANLAWATAITTSAPWFSVAVSLQVYSITLLVATFLTVALVFFAATRATALDAALRRLDRRITLFRASPARSGVPTARPVPLPRDLVSDPEADLDGPVEGDELTILGLEKRGHDTLIELPEAVQSASAPARTEVLRELVRERVAVREARDRVWTTALGPVAMSLLFLAVAAPMLPGAEGFAAVHFQLNTTVILFLAYGLAPLVAWSAICLGMLVMSGRRGSE